MTARVWLYEQLTEFPGLVTIWGDRVFAKKSMTSNREEHPFGVYKLGYAANEDIAEEMPEDKDVYRQFAQVFIHDYSDEKTGDYMRIDDIIYQLKLAVHGKGSAEHGVINCKVIEVSQDLNDETLNTVFKYVRLQLATKEK